MFYNDTEEQGYSSYYDSSMAGLGAYVRMGAFDYTPDLQPVETSAGQSSYYPRDTSQDAAALNYLGYYPQELLAAHVGTTGSQQGDEEQSKGAWDPSFQQAVKDFQTAHGLTVDGWIGPNTRTSIKGAVDAKNAQPVPVPVTPVAPVVPVVPVVPVTPVSPPAPNPQVQPASATSSHLPLLIGGGIAAAVLGYFLFVD